MADDEDPRAGEAVTINYGWTKPNVMGSDDQWGGYLNADLDSIDAIVHGIDTRPIPAALTVSDTAPATPTVGQMWFDSVGGQTYLWVDDGNTRQWVVAVNPGAGSSGTYLPLNGGVLSGAISGPSATFGNLSAPQAIGDNRIINGDMRIDQRGLASGGGGTAFSYTVDRWAYGGTQLGKGQWGRGVNIPSPSAGFPYSLTFTSASAYATPAAEQYIFYQPIEADQISDFQFGTTNAQPVTLSFWAYSTLNGNFSGALQNYAQNRSYPFSYPVVANTWTKAVIAIPGDTGGTWVMKGNAGAAYLIFDLGSGTTSRGPANAWASATYTGVTGAVSVVAVNGAQLLVTGVKLEVGSVATPFNRQSVAKSAADCERYFRWLPYDMQLYASAAGASLSIPMTFSAMRAAPTISAIAADPNVTQATANVATSGIDTATAYGVRAFMSATATGSAYQIGYRVSASAEL